MTISTSQSEITVAGTGSQTSFGFPFIADSASDIVVSYVDADGNVTPLATNQYTLTLNAPLPNQLWGAGGVVVYPLSGPPIDAGTYLNIQRVLQLTQEITVRNQGNFYAQVTEQALDTLEMQLQQISARSGQIRGVWASGITYNYADVVIDGTNGNSTGIAYFCAFANVSDTWSSDLAAGDWVQAFSEQLLPSVITTGPYFSPTGSAVPPSGNGIYLPAINTIGIASNGALCAAFLNPPSSVNYLEFSGSPSAGAGVAYNTIQSVGTNSHIGIQYEGKGTTTTDGQYNGVSGGPYTTGTHDFYCAGVLAVSMTDTYFNPSTYSLVDGAVLLSSGSSQGGAETSVCIGAIVSNPATASSASTRIFGQGPIGEIHAVTNGYVCGTFAAGTNPNGDNEYADSYWIGISGVAQGTGARPSMSLQSSNGVFASPQQWVFYHAGAGDFAFESDNTNSAMFHIKRLENAVNYISVEGGIAGTPAVCTLSAGGGSADIDILIAGKGAGLPRLGTYTGTPGSITGYITVKDAGGTSRKLAVTS